MRYQQYKNRMLKIRRVIDFFYRFRFVFAGAIAVIVAASITLDVTRGNITQTSEFKAAYTYGEEINCSGSAFMGKVTYEFRRKGDQEWSEEKPIYPGQYEARAKSKGSHGYKYSDESTFEIKPYETTFKIKEGQINFGDDSPELTYTLLPGDRLDENYIVDYADKTVKGTVASINTNSIKIYNKDNVDVTPCYSITTINQDIEFIPKPLTVTFTTPDPFTYTGDTSNPFTADEFTLSDTPCYGAHLVVTSSTKQVDPVTNLVNAHTVAIVDDNGNDYTVNYKININNNKITVKKAPAITITSSALEKTYDDSPFDINDFTITKIDGLLTNVHEIKDIVFNNTAVKTCAETKNLTNTFTYKIVDKRTGEEINPDLYYQGGVVINAGKINIKPVPITIKSPTINHDFDNKDVKGYKEGDPVNYTGNLVGEDFIKVIEYPTVHTPGKYSNDYKCKVYRQMMVDSVLTDVDVSSNYDIKYDLGDINITIDPIVIKFDGHDLPYNGLPQNVYQNNNQGHIISGALPTGWTYSAEVYDNLTNHDPLTMTNVLANDQGYVADETQVAIEIWDEFGNPVTENYVIDNNPSHDNDSSCDVTFVFEESRVTKVDLDVTVTDFDPVTYNHMTFEEMLDLNSRVSSVGIKGDDEVVVTYSDESQKLLKDAKATPYSIGLNIQVVNKINNQPTGGNYNIHYNRAEPITSSFKINKKNVKIHTPNLEMVYSDSTIIPQKDIKFDNVVVYDEYDNPIDDLAVSYNKSKTYDAPSAEVGVRTYTSFEDTDIIISDKVTGEIYQQSGVKDNYVIDLIEDGVVDITPRYIEIYQVDDESKDHIFYDEQYHGVYNGSQEIEYTLQDDEQEIGLLTSKVHVLNFTNSKSTCDANEPGNPTKYGLGVADKTAYYGVKILRNNDPLQDVTGNYDIQYPDDYIRINIIKKKVDITSGSDKKVFDGNVFDLYTEYQADEWVDIDDMKAAQFQYTVTRYDDTVDGYVSANLDVGDRLQVKKTIPSILADSKNVGNHTNDFEWRIVDENGVKKSDGFYNVNKNTGVLEVKKLNIQLLTDNRNKEYDSNNITFPNGQPIDIGYDGYQMIVHEDTREQGVCLEYLPVYDYYGPDPSKTISFNKTAFESNFTIVATIFKRSYAKFYLAGDYDFDMQTYIYTKSDELYSDTSNVELSFYNATLNYRVTKPRLEIQRTTITSTVELRILIGTLRGNDVLYFGTEKYTAQLGKKPRKWEATFDRSNVHIYRNDDPSDDVTDCYYIVM